MLDINKLCSSETPKIYNSNKLDKRSSPEKDAALKTLLFERMTFFEKFHVYKSSNCPEPTKSYTSELNSKYIAKLKEKASEIGKIVISHEDYKKCLIVSNNIIKENKLLPNLFAEGKSEKIEIYFDPSKNTWTKKKNGKFFIANLDIDFLRLKENKGLFIQSMIVPKSITLNNITFKIEQTGIDILMAVTEDILKKTYPKVDFIGYALAIDKENQTAMLLQMNNDVLSASRNCYINRIKTIGECAVSNNFFSYDILSGGSNGIVKLPISKRTIDLREKNPLW